MEKLKEKLGERVTINLSKLALLLGLGAALASPVAAWALLNSRVEQHENRLTSVENKVDKQGQVAIEIKEINTKLFYIESMLKDLKEKK